MGSQQLSQPQEGQISSEQLVFDALTAKDFNLVKEIIKKNPKLNLNCVDKTELSPLQHACHFGDVDLARFLLDNGADVNFANRKDGYTPLMFAAISSKVDVVRLLLERGVDITIENCVNRTAAQMAAFVGQSKIVSIINNWVPYETTVEPYTICQELEDKPRIPSADLARLLHNYIVYPSLHAIKLFLFIKENPKMMQYAENFIYVLENLSSKSLKPPNNDECNSLKYYYFAYVMKHCSKLIKMKHDDGNTEQTDELFNQVCEKSISLLIKKMIKREDPDDTVPCTKQLDHFLLECMLKYPYTQLAIFKTMTFALSKKNEGDINALAVLTQTLNGPRMFNHPEETCSICGEFDKNKKCSRCKITYYCGPACQMADWFQHKKVCRPPEEKPLLSENGDPND